MLVALAQSLLDTWLNQWIQATIWLWPVLEILHFIGLSLLMGGLLLMDLRLAGFFRGFTVAATHRLIPLALAGFSLNLITGVLFFVGDPMRYSVNIGFQIKMILVCLAGVNALVYYLRFHARVSQWHSDTDFPPAVRVVAWLSLLLWTGVLLCGRLIPYVGTG